MIPSLFSKKLKYHNFLQQTYSILSDSEPEVSYFKFNIYTRGVFLTYLTSNDLGLDWKFQ